MIACPASPSVTPPTGAARRLVVVIDSLDVGGAEVQTVAVLPELAKHGWSIELVTITGRERLAPALAGRGVRVLSRPRASGRLALLGRLLWLAGTLLKLAGARPRPVLYALLPYATVIAGPITLLRGCPLTVGRRSRNFYRQALHPVLRWIEGQVVRRADAVVANAEASRQDLIAEGAEPDRVVVIANGVDPDRVRPAGDPAALRRELGIGPDTLVLLQVANFFPYKGHADLLAALSVLRRANGLPTDWLAVFAGRDPAGSENLDRLRAQARELGLLDRIRIGGERSDIGSLLGIGHIAVCASHQEGLSNALLEAMAAGLAVVSTDVGGHREALADGRAGLVVPPHAPEALAAALGRLLHDPDLRARLGAAAAERAVRNYSLTTSAHALSLVLERVRERHRPAS